MQADYIAGFRYLPRKSSKGEQLAVGFAVNRSSDENLERTRLRWKTGQKDTEPWVGMTCAACHTTELNYIDKLTEKATQIRVDGGPALADFQAFLEALNLALAETVADQDKWQRFAGRVLRGDEDNAQNRDLLKTAFAALLAWQQRE